MNNANNQIDRRKDIAIVGMSGKFSQSENIEAFWENLTQGKELIKLYSNEELRDLGIDEKLIRDPNYILANSLLQGSESFDYSFFGYTKDEAAIMDPQIRIMHEQVWLTLEDAGCNPDEYAQKIGLYLSASDNLNWRAHTLLNASDKVSQFMATRLANKTFISTLISYNLGLTGPSYYTDTACSSSLTSVHLACRSLLMKECSMALAGAVSIITTEDMGYWYEDGMVFSKDGHCRAFDKDSSGTFFGEGVGVVALKRFDDAIRDNDHIYAVIKASAVNNDGKRKVGYTAPSVSGQADCIKLAHKIAKVEPESVSYIEAHGTGTKLGDPIEVEALNMAFNHNTRHQCAIGSVKTNLGHLDSVAGIVGLLKTSLALKHRKLPASINFNAPNPDINFKSGPFYVNNETVDWKNQNGQALRAGVSSFGIGGTNAHIVMEEAPQKLSNKAQHRYQLIPFSAKTKNSLQNYKSRFQGFIPTKGQDFTDIAYTLQTGRKHFDYRAFVVAKTAEEAYKELKDLKPTVSKAGRRRNVFMFSGGGSQYFEMAKELYLHEPLFKEILDSGFDLLREKTGDDYKLILGYGAERENCDSDLINSIIHMLPALFLIEFALARLIMSMGVLPAYMIGHSLGEYVAACLSGVFSFEDALDMVLLRGTLTNKLPEGGMVGVELSAEKVRPYLTEKLSIATINMEDSCVVSGAKEDIEQFTALLEKEKIEHTRLKISIAAHSVLLNEILDEYREAVSKIQLFPPQIPFISNLSGQEVTKEEVTSPEYWVSHLRNTVNFLSGIGCLLEKGPANYIEIGSGGALTSFLKSHKLFTNQSFGINVLRHPKEADNDHEYFLRAIGKLWQHGTQVDWTAFNAKNECRKISIPGYAFDQTRLHVKVDPFRQMMEEGMLVNSARNSIADSFCYTSWKKSLLPKYKAQESKKSGYYLVFSNSDDLSQSIITALQKSHKVIVVEKGEAYRQEESLIALNPLSQGDFQALFSNLDEQQVAVDQVIYTWSFPGEAEALKPCIPVIHLSQNLLINQVQNLSKITFLGDFGDDVYGHEEVNIPQVLARKTLAMVVKNNSPVFFSFIDIEMEDTHGDTLENILNDFETNFSDSHVAYRNRQRWVQCFEKLPVDKNKQPNKAPDINNILIINGLSANGPAMARHLVTAYNANVILVGTEKVNLEDSPNTEAAKALKELQSRHKSTHYYQADIQSVAQFKELVVWLEKEYGNISGVVYLVEQGSLTNLADLDNLLDVQGKRLNALNNLNIVFGSKDPDFVWLPVKLSSVISKTNEDIYADTYACAFAKSIQKEGGNWTVVAIDDLNQQAPDDNEIAEIFDLSVSCGLSNPIISLTEINRLEKEHQFREKQEEHEVADNMEVDESNFVAPETELQKELCDLWQTFLGYKVLGIEDNFFDLGGNSLKAMTLLKRIQKDHGIQVTLKDFFKKPTVRLIAEEINIARLIKSQNAKKETKVLKI